MFGHALLPQIRSSRRSFPLHKSFAPSTVWPLSGVCVFGRDVLKGVERQRLISRAASGFPSLIAG